MDETSQAILRELREIKALLLAQATRKELEEAAFRVLLFGSEQEDLHDILQTLSRVARLEPQRRLETPVALVEPVEFSE